MSNSKRLVILLSLAIVFCFTMFMLAIKSFSSSSWQTWQIKYYQAQIAMRQNNMAKVEDEEQIGRIKLEIEDLQQKKPNIQEIHLSNGQIERCKTCHLGIEEISKSHPSGIGCTICHGGNALSLDEKTAHEGMYGGGHPGQLDVARLSCGGGSTAAGQCHSGNRHEIDNQVDLMATSLMAGKGGELSMTRYMYGLDIPPKVLLKPGENAANVQAPFNHRPEEPKFQQNCLSACHQTKGRLEGQQAQANGCESCHVLSNSTHTYEGQDITISRQKSGYGISHKLTVQIPYTQCNQCHNQGEYKLYTMDFTPRSDLNRVKASLPPDRESLESRWQNVYSPGLVFTQCEVNLDCIDCHTRKEAMGDGEMYSSEWNALKLQCQDCHGSTVSKPQGWKITDKSDIAWAEARINSNFPPLNIGDTILKTLRGEELPYVRQENGQWYSYRKTNGEKFLIPQVIGSDCQQDPNKQSADNCHQCHDVSKNKPTSGAQ